MLQSEFQTPDAEWVFYDNENAILNAAYSYGTSKSELAAEGQAFSRKVRHVVSSAGESPWNAAWGLRNRIVIQQNDVLLAVFYLRSLDGPGKVTFFVENAQTYAKEVELTFPVDEQWRRYLIPFDANASYGVDGLTWGFHLAFQAQTIEIGGFTALNFDRKTGVGNLPREINNERYDGWEPDAPWRAEAARRIDQLRKADLRIQVKDSNGQPVEKAAVAIRMLRHEFAFGSAVTAHRLAGNNGYNATYEEKIVNLDGQGHGFNWVVFENDLKWPAWENEWLVNKTELGNAVDWLMDHDVRIRGHNLVWPGANNLPTDVANNAGNITFVKNRINNHLEEILTWPDLRGKIAEWDVLNEIATNRTLEEAFAGQAGYTTGRELYVETFQKARAMDSNTGLWLNDYVTISRNAGPGNGLYDRLKQFTAEIVASGVDIEGLGFQSHIGGFPNGIPPVLATLDDFYDSFGLKAKVTEFDLPDIVHEELAANYLRDYLTAIFSHPSMNGFFFWSFWDGATYMNPGANLFRQDWSLTPAGQAFIDLVFDEWWTDEYLSASAAGEINTRVFKGLYEISYQSNGETVRDTIHITETQNYNIVSDDITTDTDAPEAPGRFRLFPNPSSGTVYVRRNATGPARVRVFDLTGKIVLEMRTNDERVRLNLNGRTGLYAVEVESRAGVQVDKVWILPN